MNLSEFLLARIAEDEEEPKLVREGWRDLADMLPMGAWDSERVLAECEARRQIVQAWRDAGAIIRSLSDERDISDVRFARIGLETAIQALALPYADHPDYDLEWKP